MNIKLKGMLLSFILILAVTVIIGISAYYRCKDILVQEEYSAVIRVAKEAADHLNNYITQYITPLEGLSENSDIRTMEWMKQKVIIKAQINPQYENIAVVDLNGIAHYIDDTTVDLSDREYIKNTLLGIKSFSEIIISRKTGTPVIMAGVPIYRDNKLVGALIARLDVDFLSNYALTRGFGDNGRAYIISKTGALISRSDIDKHDDEYNLFDISLKDSDYTSLSEFVKASNKNQSGYGSYVFDDKKIIMGYALINETNWRVYIGSNEADILKSLDGLKKLFLALAVFTILICTAAAWIFVDRFTKPIIKLDDLFSRGALGDLTIRFTPKSKDEIGRLGISFNRMMDKIKTLTHYDPLTGLLNQYVLEKDVDIYKNNDSHMNFSLIMVAIDRLSFINDTYGYTIGDAVVKELAERINTYASHENSIYRYKGDEFVILYSEGQEENSLKFTAMKMMEDLSKSYLINGKTIVINVNIGIFTYNDDTKDEDPLKAVTLAKNYSKSQGLYQVQKFDKLIHNKIKQYKELQADIINGLEENQFFLLYQPLFNLKSGKIAELEALIRWNHPERGLLYPDKFIDLAETSGAIINIDKWVLESACSLLKSRRENEKPPLLLSINISARTFEMKDFIPNLLSVIHQYEVDPATLQLEITERMLLNNSEECIDKLNELRSMGIKVAIDDFGIGYSSLSYIIRLPVDSIKIDKSFIQNMSSSAEAKVIVSTIISLCKALNLNVIAEGIEKVTELDYLKLNHCDIGQGYYFSMPESITEIEKKHYS
jgi:diguanylate cyclase (GGDEF)-like protein